MKAHYTMSKQEIDRLEVVQKLLEKRWTQERASQVLQIGVRQVQRLLQAYRTQGVSGLISKKRGKPSNNKIADTIKQYALSLIKERYVDFGPTLAAEKLF